jgi:hypothetical protein
MVQQADLIIADRDIRRYNLFLQAYIHRGPPVLLSITRPSGAAPAFCCSGSFQSAGSTDNRQIHRLAAGNPASNPRQNASLITRSPC